jgi:hypothetical protein
MLVQMHPHYAKVLDPVIVRADYRKPIVLTPTSAENMA